MTLFFDRDVENAGRIGRLAGTMEGIAFGIELLLKYGKIDDVSRTTLAELRQMLMDVSTRECPRAPIDLSPSPRVPGAGSVVK